ncbi:hypothetical protein GGX14DRAFT_404620 [Mycena pura]|uniref:Uncharacterized protein n=1 Tax=Mycena pura TaxID=153505 RepID=A0AAD6UVK8_9AGAR|nr:hypothetical protein GGX14DRAFT_404620 [Mycena pura]
MARYDFTHINKYTLPRPRTRSKRIRVAGYRGLLLQQHPCPRPASTAESTSRSRPTLANFTATEFGGNFRRGIVNRSAASNKARKGNEMKRKQRFLISELCTREKRLGEASQGHCLAVGHCPADDCSAISTISTKSCRHRRVSPSASPSPSPRHRPQRRTEKARVRAPRESGYRSTIDQDNISRVCLTTSPFGSRRVLHATRAQNGARGRTAQVRASALPGAGGRARKSNWAQRRRYKFNPVHRSRRGQSRFTGPGFLGHLQNTYSSAEPKRRSTPGGVGVGLRAGVWRRSGTVRTWNWTEDGRRRRQWTMDDRQWKAGWKMEDYCQCQCPERIRNRRAAAIGIETSMGYIQLAIPHRLMEHTGAGAGASAEWRSSRRHHPCIQSLLCMIASTATCVPFSLGGQHEAMICAARRRAAVRGPYYGCTGARGDDDGQWMIFHHLFSSPCDSIRRADQAVVVGWGCVPTETQHMLMWGCGAGIPAQEIITSRRHPGYKAPHQCGGSRGSTALAPATRSVLLCCAGTRFLVDLGPIQCSAFNGAKGPAICQTRAGTWASQNIYLWSVASGLARAFEIAYYFNWDSLQHPRDCDWLDVAKINLNKFLFTGNWRSKWKHGRKVFQGTRGACRDDGRACPICSNMRAWRKWELWLTGRNTYYILSPKLIDEEEKKNATPVEMSRVDRNDRASSIPGPTVYSSVVRAEHDFEFKINSAHLAIEQGVREVDFSFVAHRCKRRDPPNGKNHVGDTPIAIRVGCKYQAEAAGTG